MAAFEYKIVTSTDSDEDDETMLNDLGAQGFELVGVTSSEVVMTYAEGESGGSGDEDDSDGEEYVEEVITYYMKRQKVG